MSVSLKCASCGVDQTLKLSVSPLYSVNIVGIATWSFSGEMTYGVQNKKISSSSTENPVNYFVGAKIYPLAFLDGRSGAYFDKWEWARLLSIEGGLSLEHPTERIFVGVSLNTPVGLSVGIGYQPFKKEQLKAGYAVGQDFDDTSAPVDKIWRNRFALSLMADSSVVKTLIGLFK